MPSSHSKSTVLLPFLVVMAMANRRDVRANSVIVKARVSSEVG